jgi:hypothetical protein
VRKKHISSPRMRGKTNNHHTPAEQNAECALPYPVIKHFSGSRIRRPIKKEESHVQTTSATGATLSEVPMTIKRSILSKSSFNDSSNASLSFSPKKVMSGYKGTAKMPHIPENKKAQLDHMQKSPSIASGSYAHQLTFITPGG